MKKINKLPYYYNKDYKLWLRYVAELGFFDIWNLPWRMCFADAYARILAG